MREKTSRNLSGYYDHVPGWARIATALPDFSRTALRRNPANTDDWNAGRWAVQLHGRQRQDPEAFEAAEIVQEAEKVFRWLRPVVMSERASPVWRG
jgi:hypothetical protein